MNANRRNLKRQAWEWTIGPIMGLGMALVISPARLHAQAGFDLSGWPCRYYVTRQVDSGGVPMVKSDSAAAKTGVQRSDTLKGPITGKVVIDTTATMPMSAFADKNMDSILRTRYPRVVDIQLDCNIKKGP